MTVDNRKLKSFVTRLLELSKTDGVVDAEKVTTVMNTLKTSKTKNLRETLELYRFMVKKDLKETTAKVSYAGELSKHAQETLLTSLESQYGRKLMIELEEDPSLIAGIKVSIGDYVFDQSAKRILQQISETI